MSDGHSAAYERPKEGPVGRSWYRDGYLFEPLANGRTRIDFVASDRQPRPLVIDAGSFAALVKAMTKPERVWSDRGFYARR